MTVESLPTELLLSVFERVALLPPDMVGACPLWTCNQVCRRWRHVIMSSPTLWGLAAKPMHDSKRLFVKKLQRSNPTLLNLCVDLSLLPEWRQAIASSNILIAMRLVHRIQTFSFAGNPYLIDELVHSQHWSKTADHLDEFALLNSLAPMDIVDIDPLLKSMRAPRLRSLHLEGCTFDWSRLKFRTLTYLAVQEVPLRARPTHDEVLSKLSAIPNLRHLVLSETLSKFNDSTESSMTTLQSLQTIQLGGSLEGSCRLLQRLHLPSLQTFLLFGECSQNTDLIARLRVVSTTASCFRPQIVRVRTAEDELSFLATDVAYSIAIRLKWPPSTMTALFVLFHLCRSLQLEGVHTFYVVAHKFATCSVGWYDVLRLFPVLRKVTVVEGRVEELLSELALHGQQPYIVTTEDPE